ncbi:MAG: ribonuclease P protein component [Clostridiales bacterium]
MLPQQYRLKERRDFRRIYHRGQVKACGAFVVYVCPSRPKGCKIGFSVSKKIGNAVVRNRLKRMFRHGAYQLIDRFEPNKSYVFVIRAAAKELSFQELLEELSRALTALNGGHSSERAK